MYLRKYVQKKSNTKDFANDKKLQKNIKKHKLKIQRKDY